MISGSPRRSNPGGRKAPMKLRISSKVRSSSMIACRTRRCEASSSPRSSSWRCETAAKMSCTGPSRCAACPAVYARHGVMAPSQPLASAAGLAVLEKGGNAIDAAVTAVAVLNLVEPFMTGVGGDMFALFWSAREHKLVGLNASGRSGSLMTHEELAPRGHTTVPLYGPEPITVPVALSGLDPRLDRYGTLTVAQA